MLFRWIALLGVVAALTACASTPQEQANYAWNDGIWNSVLGYVGPANVVVAGGPSGH